MKPLLLPASSLLIASIGLLCFASSPAAQKSDDKAPVAPVVAEGFARMKTRVDADARRNVGEFDGGCNIEAAKAPPMHQARFHFVDEDHIQFEGDLFAAGEKSETKPFDLVRMKK